MSRSRNGGWAFPKRIRAIRGFQRSRRPTQTNSRNTGSNRLAVHGRVNRREMPQSASNPAPAMMIQFLLNHTTISCKTLSAGGSGGGGGGGLGGAFVSG